MKVTAEESKFIFKPIYMHNEFTVCEAWFKDFPEGKPFYKVLENGRCVHNGFYTIRANAISHADHGFPCEVFT